MDELLPIGWGRRRPRIWLHSECWPPWYDRVREIAIRRLVEE